MVGIVELDTRVALPRTLFCMLGHPLRTKGLRIEICFEAIMNAVQHIDHTQGVGVGAHFLLLPGGFHLHPRDAGIKKMPFHRVDVSLSIRETVVNRRRKDPGRGANGGIRRRIGRLRIAAPKHRRNTADCYH